MLKTDFIHIMSDAIQQHEGWVATGGSSWPNLNPGNLDFTGQIGATANGRWAKFGSFYDGKQALNVDIGAKMVKLNTIRDIITEYAPSSENDTEAYIAAVCAFFLSRNVAINPDSPIDAFLSRCQIPVILCVINQLYTPADWTAIQAALQESAKYMPLYAFSTRYSNAPLSGDIIELAAFEVNGVAYPSFAAVNAAATNAAIAPYNQGQVLNILIYDGAIMVGHPQPVGGCEWQRQTLNGDPVTAFASMMYQGPAFADILAGYIVHELTHELFDITKQPDTLHEYLITHNGYPPKSIQGGWEDLTAVLTGNQLNTPAAVKVLQNDLKVEEQAASSK